MAAQPASSKTGDNTIAIIGLGYVGLPLALRFAQADCNVVGLDIDPAKIEKLRRGQSYIKHIPAESISSQLRRRRFDPSNDFSRLAEVEAVIICVPTPLGEHREPDLSYVLNTGRTISRYLKHGQLIVLESTTYPGTTDTELREVLETGSGLKAGSDFNLAFSPEREDPGNTSVDPSAVPKLVGGLTHKCTERTCALYKRAFKTVVPVSSCRVAEAAKLLENIFRSVNIALVNELKLVYEAMGIDIWEVIEAAKTKPFGFMAFYPGPGLGGHCIPIDPFYLTWKARAVGKDTKFIELAGQINTAMPDYVVQKVSEALNAHRKALNGSKVLVLGLAYKPNVDDDRESPAYRIMDLLKARGADVSYYDPHIPVIKPTREYSHWAGTRSVAWQRKTISQFDAVVIVTHHDAVNYAQLAQWANCIIDTRNVMARVRTRPGQVWKA
ncbi:MAG: nucleotide sugar dehydrogenase [Verrucomicrobiae bacterium]|nr:nucleotide sugar dehydrogenase [Verrucomicrobiae bacterium]MCX7722561.1 nucleotide sugar dehydrogenase [Verrucomicrobiae bacterium]MDW7979817.1 nucleotide sugar dehydrogenase [Verrucomicrobiales bacterium]